MIVVDTNVLAYLWLPGDLTPAAERLLAAQPEWAVPLLWRSEFRSVLAGAVKRKALALDRAVALVEAAETHLQGREFAVASSHVLTLADGSGCSTYDCEFVALAEDLGVPLITNDREVLRAFPRIASAFEQYR